MRRAGHVLVTCLAVFLSTVPARGQQSKGSFAGTVTDPSGGVVPGVNVTATERDTGFTHNAVTASDGVYILPLLPPGQYVITAEKQGFEKFSAGPITLAVDQQAKLDVQLRVGQATTTVQVEASAPVLDTESSSVGTTVGETEVQQLPFNGRQFLETMLFTPGVVPGTQGSELNNNRGGSINVNGLRESMNTFLIDGMSDTSIAVGTYSATPPLDSIQEFRMETGVYDAKFGTNAGAQVNIVTKSGTNQYHGTLYEYFRNNDLDARNYFDPYVAPFHRNQFGASVGGPLSIGHLYNGRDKTFFFLNYEGLLDKEDFFSRAYVPTLAEQGGDFSDIGPGSGCPTPTVLINPVYLAEAQQVAPFTNFSTAITPYTPAGLPIDPVGKAFGNVYPTPNIPGVSGAGATCGQVNYSTLVDQKVYTNDYVGRFDHRWGTKDSAFYRYNLTTDSEFSPSGIPTGLPGFGAFRTDWFTATGFDWTHTFTPTLLNDFKVDYNRWQYRWNNQDEGQYYGYEPPFNIAGIPTAFRDSGLPNIGLSDTAIDGLGSSTSQPQAGAVNTFEFGDTLTQVHGSHSLAYGAQIRSIKRGDFFIDEYARSNFSFDGVVTNGFGELTPTESAGLCLETTGQANCNIGNGFADLLLGIPTSWNNGYSQYISGTASELDFFGQDTWKARRNLTLTLGLRYEYNTLVTEKSNRFGAFDFSYDNCPTAGGGTTPGAVLVAGTSSVGIDCFKGAIGAAGATGAFEQVGTLNLGNSSENRALQEPDYRDIGPRLGFAWQPFSNSKTVLRGGGGIYYDQMTGELYFQKSANPPFVNLEVGDLQDEKNVAIPLFLEDLGTGKGIQGVFVTPNETGALFPVVNPVILDLKNARVYEWSLDLQRELGRSWLLDVGYVGTRGTHLPWFWNPNQNVIPSESSNPAATLAECQTVGCPRPYPEYLDFTYTDDSGASIYNALQVKVERHYSSGLAIIGAYTYGQSLDTNSTYDGSSASTNFPQNDYQRNLEMGPSDFDYRQRFSLAYVYSLPFGNTVGHLSNPKLNYVIQDWQLAGIAFVQSGAPFTVELGTNNSGANDSSSGGDDRPNVVSGVSPYPTKQTVSQWVVPSAFSEAAPFTFGDAGRNSLRGPGEADWDFSIIRDFRLTESKKLEFRAEMFNILNQPNFTLPNSTFLSSSFGVIPATVQPIAGQASGGPGDPREIQFALRFVW